MVRNRGNSPSENRDYWQAHWPATDFVERKVQEGHTKADIARAIGANNDVVLYLWLKKGYLPFSAFKAMMSKLTRTPEEREEWERKVKLVKSARPAMVTRETFRLARQYDAENINKSFAIKGGGRHIVQAGTPEPEPAAATAAAVPGADRAAAAASSSVKPLAELVALLPEPQQMVIPTAMGDIVVTIPARQVDKERGTHELLIQISQRLLAEKEQAERHALGLRSQIATLTAHLGDAQRTIQKQAEDLKAYEELLAGAGEAAKGTLFLPPEIEKATKEVLKQNGATSLSRYLDSLPKHQARS